MTDATATRIADQLTALGRPVDPGTVRARLAELGGLDPGAAESLLLATYGLTPDGRPSSAFSPERSSGALVRDLLRDARPAVRYVAIAALAGLVPGVAVPLLLRIFVNSYLGEGDPQWIVPVLVGVAGAAAVSALVVGLQQAVLRRSVLRLSKSGQVGFAWRALHINIPDLTRFGSGDLAARANAQHRLAYQGGLFLPLACVNIGNVAVFATALLLLNVLLGLTALAVAVLTVTISGWVLRRRRAVQARSDAELLALSERTAEILTAMESIRAAAWEQFAFAGWARRANATAGAIGRLGVANQWVVLVPATATALGLGGVLAAGTWLVMRGDVSLGTVVAAQSFTVLLLDGLAMLAYAGVLFQSIASAGRQVQAVGGVPLDPEVVDVGTQDSHAVRGEVALRNVSFGYDRDAPPFLAGLELSVGAGSRLALVGGSGSGKTTLARLIVGELRPWTGHVELDGQPRLAVPRGLRTAGVAYVPQEPTLFPGTLADNLTMWADVPEQQMRRAARDAAIEDAILRRAGGYAARVTAADSGFSGGEMQRLAIARALVGDPAVLVLDEATSALDPVVEAEVEQNLRRRGCTCVVVAHRLSTIRDADEIVVLAAGRIVQRGTFDELRAVAGPFAELLHD